MGTVESIVAGNARRFPATTCQQRQDSAEPLWFALLCRDLWGTNAPKELEYALKRNGIDRSDRTCRAWAAGDSPPPVNVLLALQRDDECGKRVKAYVMRDCAAPWWIEDQLAMRVGYAALREAAAQVPRPDAG